MSTITKTPGAIQGKVAWLGRTVDGAMFASVKIPTFFPGSTNEYHWKYISGYLAEAFLVVPVMAGEQALFYEVIHVRSGITCSNSLSIRSLDSHGHYSQMSDRILAIKFAYLLNRIEFFLPQDQAARQRFGLDELNAFRAIATPILIKDDNLYLG